MQRKPAGDERAAKLAPSPPEPEVSAASAAAGPGPRRAAKLPTLVLRPQIHWRAIGPALILLGILVLAVGRLDAAPIALLFLLVAAGFLPALWERVEVGPTTIHQRRWRRRTTVDFGDVDTLRLRRIPFKLLAGLRRGYKVGRYWSLPLTLRLLDGDTVLLELRCGWWDGWRELARYVVVSNPELNLEGRTRGRLERYVGVPLPPVSKA
jgi:hypothetical protein